MQSYHLKQISSIWTLQDLYFINVKSLLYQTLIIDLDFSLLSNNLPASDFYSLYLMHWRANVVKESTPAIEIQKSLTNVIVFKKKWLQEVTQIFHGNTFCRAIIIDIFRDCVKIVTIWFLCIHVGILTKLAEKCVHIVA